MEWKSTLFVDNRGYCYRQTDDMAAGSFKVCLRAQVFFSFLLCLLCSDSCRGKMKIWNLFFLVLTITISVHVFVKQHWRWSFQFWDFHPPFKFHDFRDPWLKCLHGWLIICHSTGQDRGDRWKCFCHSNDYSKETTDIPFPVNWFLNEVEWDQFTLDAVWSQASLPGGCC